MFGRILNLGEIQTPFCTSCQISAMNKKARYKNSLNPRAPFKWVFMGIITATSPKRLKSKTIFSNYLLIVDSYSKILKMYGMDKNTTDKVMDKSHIFQSIFGKIDGFVWWDFERISADEGTQYTPREFKEKC